MGVPSPPTTRHTSHLLPPLPALPALLPVRTPRTTNHRGASCGIPGCRERLPGGRRRLLEAGLDRRPVDDGSTKELGAITTGPFAGRAAPLIAPSNGPRRARVVPPQVRVRDGLPRRRPGVPAEPASRGGHGRRTQRPPGRRDAGRAPVRRGDRDGVRPRGRAARAAQGAGHEANHRRGAGGRVGGGT